MKRLSIFQAATPIAELLWETVAIATDPVTAVKLREKYGNLKVTPETTAEFLDELRSY